MRVHELGPTRVPQPQRAAALQAETAAGLRPRRALARFAHHRVVDADVLAAAHRQAVGCSAEVDRITAAARRLAADRAVTMHERHGAVRFDAERHRAAMARAFEMHGGEPPVQRRE